MSINIESIVEQYIETRDERDKLVQKFEEEEAIIKSKMAELERQMLEVCNDIKANSIKTMHGTVIRQMKERFWAIDWDAFKTYVMENDLLDLMERRVAQGNMKAHVADNPAPPPGINVHREYAISVRRPNQS